MRIVLVLVHNPHAMDANNPGRLGSLIVMVYLEFF